MKSFTFSQINAFPFFIAMFVAGIGYLVGGWHAAGVAALVWLGIMIVSTWIDR